jgi:hypothetical protein
MPTEAIDRKLKGQAVAIGQIMAKAKQDLTDLFVRHHRMTREQALAYVNERPAPERAQELLQAPAATTSWFDLNELSEFDAALAAERWECVLDAARDELAGGVWAANAIESSTSTCWGHAQFLALRDDLSEEWSPRNGIERALVDMMAQALTLRMRWMQRLVVLDNLESVNQSTSNKYETPRVAMFQAIEQAAAMADRFDRMFMRALRQIRDLRRYTVVIQSANQVNIGQQQVNTLESG